MRQQPLVGSTVRGRHVPLTARYSRRKYVWWEWQNVRERVALWLAPWLKATLTAWGERRR